jgi:HK97 family phage major capsid protein
MPYLIRKRENQYCIYKETAGEPDGEPLGCHPTELAAEAQRRVLYAAEGKTAIDRIAMGGALKALAGGKVGGYALLFSGPEAKDLQGEYFTPETETLWEGNEPRPAMYHHGMDATLDGKLLGSGWRKARVDDLGVWVEAQLNLRDEYEQAIYELVQAGKLGLSSGTAGHMVQRAPDGKLTRWPIVEISFTPTPAEPRASVAPLKSVGLIHQAKSEVKQMDLLETIKQLVPGLTDDQYAQIGAVLALAGLTGEKPAAPDAEPPALDDDMIKAAVLEALGAIAPPAAPRPPYEFKPAPVGSEPPVAPEVNARAEAVKSLAVLRFGETPSGIKAVATDIYGADYEVKRHQQHVAFGRYLRHGERGLDGEMRHTMKQVILTPAQLKAFVLSGGEVSALKTDMSEAIDTLGGFLVPEDIRLDIIERLPGLTAVRPRADVTQTSSDVMIRVKVTGGDDRHVGAVRVTWVGDTPSTGDAATNPTFGVEKTPIHITLATIRTPRALLEDSAYPLSAKLSEWASQEFALDEDEQFLVGNGIAKPQGILPNSVNGLGLTEVRSTHATELRFTGLVALRYGVARQYRNGAVWIMNDTTAGVCAQMLDDAGRPLWQPSVTEGEPDRLLGYPVLTDEAMPDIAANSYPVIFGNLMGYQIADRIGMSVLRDETTHSEEDIVKFVFRRRLGGQVNRTWAFAVQKVSA